MNCIVPNRKLFLLVSIGIAGVMLSAYEATGQYPQQPGFRPSTSQGFGGPSTTPAPRIATAPQPFSNPTASQPPSAIPSIPSAAQGPIDPAVGDPSDPASQAEGDASSMVPQWAMSLKAQLVAGGTLMIPLAVCSLVVIGLIGERMLALRRGRVIPRPYVRRFREKIEDGQLDQDEAVELCSGFDCPVADVFSAAIKRSGRSAVEIETAIVDALDRAADKLRRYLRVFHAISNVAPLLGLLGTVLGMIEAFETMAAESGIGRPELLASGISQALVTTAGGLCVAIPAYLAYMYFSARADRYLGEIESLSISLVDVISAEGTGSGTKSRRRRAA